MSGNTPGPWGHYDDSKAATHRHAIVSMGKTIAHVYCTRGDEEADAANARLIAAAPDCLGALRDLLARFDPDALTQMATIEGRVRWYDGNRAAIDAARAAIAKAEGEG